MSTAVAIIALPAALVAIWMLLRTPVAGRLVALPSAERWHETPTPIIGGIGIFIGFSVGLWAAAAAGAFEVDRELVGIYAAITLVFLGGLADDLFGMAPLAKLALQGAACALVLSTGTGVQLVDNVVLGDAIAVLWLIGVANAFNLLDNMDGLAASLATIAFGFFAIDAATVHPDNAALAFALAGALACAGFLPFNLRRGRRALAFMGDSGSQTLGFAVAALGLTASWRVAGTTVATLMLPVLIVAVPILDTTLVTIARLLDGRPISQGGRDHSSHRLVRFGLSERHAVALLALVSLGIGGSSLAYTVLDDYRITIPGIVLTFALLIQFASFLADIDRRPVVIGEPRALSEVFAVHWRRVAEVGIDFVLITAAFMLAYLIQFGWPGTTGQRFIRDLTLPVILTARYLAFIPFGLYRSVWRFAGGHDAAAAIGAVLASEVVALSFMVLTQNMRDFDSSFFVIDALICMAAITGSRFTERFFISRTRLDSDREHTRTLLVGAGRNGRSMMRELRETDGERVVGFIDDNLLLRRRRVHGIPVLGTTDELARVLERVRPDLVLVTIPDAPQPRLAEIVAACESANVPCRFVRREISPPAGLVAAD